MLPVFDSHIIQVHKHGRGSETMEMFNTREYERIDLSKIAYVVSIVMLGLHKVPSHWRHPKIASHT